MIPVFSQGSQGIKMAEQMEGFAMSRYETGGETEGNFQRAPCGNIGRTLG